MKQDSRSKTVKLVGTKRYEVALKERHTGEYYVEYTLGLNDPNPPIVTSDILDYDIASRLFNAIYGRLEGH